MVTPRISGTAQDLATGAPNNKLPDLGVPLSSQGSCLFQGPKAAEVRLAQGGPSQTQHEQGPRRLPKGELPAAGAAPPAEALGGCVSEGLTSPRPRPDPSLPNVR